MLPSLRQTNYPEVIVHKCARVGWDFALYRILPYTLILLFQWDINPTRPEGNQTQTRGLSFF